MAARITQFDRQRSAKAGGYARSAEAESTITVVVPTYREAESLPHLLDRLADLRQSSGLPLDVLIMDDDSNDGSAELVAARAEPWIRFVVRKDERGLSEAVLDGLRQATGDILICMDADLSHPPHSIPQMLAKLQEGADFVVGSRYVEGGSEAHDGGFFRWLRGRVATAMARPLTNLQDPMAGYFALRRTTFENGGGFNPTGYKIGLELLVKCRCERVVEVPIHFEERKYGQSKLTLRPQLLYIQHLRRLYMFRHGFWTEVMQFLVVGGLGTVINLGLLTAFVALGAPDAVAVAGAILLSMLSNFILNRRFSFSGTRDHSSWLRQIVTFFAATSVGALLNYVTALKLNARFPALPLQVAALGGIAVGTVFNFAASRYLVFRRSHIRRDR